MRGVVLLITKKKKKKKKKITENFIKGYNLVNKVIPFFVMG